MEHQPSSQRIAMLDIEASALGYRSYPIEVGLALIEGSQPIRSWSSLIRPTGMWMDGGHWSSASAEVHGISFDLLLQEGKPVREICDWLNAALANTIVLTDAPDDDQSWLSTLFNAADSRQTFSLRDYDALAGTLAAEQLRRHTRILDRDRTPHRAGEDALRLASAYLEARTGTRPSIVTWI